MSGNRKSPPRNDSRALARAESIPHVARPEIISFKRIDRDFPVEGLRADLTRVSEEDWLKHKRQTHYKGRYHGVPLISVEGSTLDLTTHHAEVFKSTPLLEKCPSFQAALDEFKCAFHRVRLMRLDPGAHIRRHVDPLDGRNNFIARLHVPIRTNDRVDFMLWGKRVPMRPGECWYIDPAFPHSVTNRGDTPRVHLVVDCVINDFINELVGFDIPKRRRDLMELYLKYERRHQLQNRIVNRWDNFSRQVRTAARLSLTNPAELLRKIAGSSQTRGNDRVMPVSKSSEARSPEKGETDEPANRES